MRIYVYDSAYHSAENGYGGRLVFWGLRDGDSAPVCLNVIGAPCQALLELPATAQNRRMRWGDQADLDTKIVRGRIENYMALALGDSPLARFYRTERFRMHGYHQEKSHYYTIETETREELDAAIKKLNGDLKDFLGDPVWRETEISPSTKTFVQRGWDATGWFGFREPKVRFEAPPERPGVGTGEGYWEPPAPQPCCGAKPTLRPTLHYYVHADNIRHVSDPEEYKGYSAGPTVLFLDFETFRSDLEGFPDASLPADLAYMCACTVLDGSSGATRKYIIVVGDPARDRLEGVEVMPVESEEAMYEALAGLINYENPDVLSGYNIHGFDLKYMEKRLALCGRELPDVSRLPGKPSSFELARGPRGARYTNLKAPGRIALDLFLYLIKNTTRQELANFSLKTVTEYYLRKQAPPESGVVVHLERSGGAGDFWTAVADAPGCRAAVGRTLREALEAAAPGAVARALLHSPVGEEELAACPSLGSARGCGIDWRRNRPDADANRKIDLDYKRQFRLYLDYLLGNPTGPESLGIVAEYCMRDTDVLPALWNNRGIWASCAKFSEIFGSTIQTVAIAGQVERLTPMLYRYVYRSETVIEVNPVAGTCRFEGGLCKLTTPGIHRLVCTGDFSSLYPSLIIWLNLCWTTRVMELDTTAFMRAHPETDYHISPVEYQVDKGGGADPDEGFGEDAGFEGAGSESGSSESGSDEEGELDGAGASGEEARKLLRKARNSIKKKEAFNQRKEKLMYVGSGVKEGIIPRALKELLAERSSIRKQLIPKLKGLAKEAEKAGDPGLAAQYKQLASDADKRQNAIKVAANSIYGIMGAAAPYADPYVGMVTTAEGRRVIQLSTEKMLGDSPGSYHVYTDTDSSMVADPGLGDLPVRCLNSPAAIRLEDLGPSYVGLPGWCTSALEGLLAEWTATRREIEEGRAIPLIQERCSAMCAGPDNAGIYRKPMKFEFENLVLVGIWFKKKMYICRVFDEEKKVVTIKERGILLRRADYPEIVKGVYRIACFGLLDGKSPGEAVMGVLAGMRRILLGAPLEFGECSTSSDFKSVSEYKEATCKMAVLARHAESLGVPLQDDTRIDSVMLVRAGYEGRCRDTILYGKGGSENLATPAMARILGREIDRDYYLKVITSHVDALMRCALAGRVGDRVYVLERSRVPPHAPNYLVLATHDCPVCKKPMEHSVGWHEDARSHFRREEGGVQVEEGCPRCGMACAQADLLRRYSAVVAGYAEPAALFTRIYSALIRAAPEARVEEARERALEYAERLYAAIY